MTKACLGLDAQRSWIVCNEANILRLAGAGSLHRQTPPSIWFGPLPPKLAAAAREKLRDFARAGHLRQVPRSE